jgi:hypothetical protein
MYIRHVMLANMWQQLQLEKQAALFRNFVETAVVANLPDWKVRLDFDHHEIDVDVGNGQWEIAQWQTPACVLLRSNDVCTHVIELHAATNASAVIAITLSSGVHVPAADFFTSKPSELRSHRCFAQRSSSNYETHRLHSSLITYLVDTVAPTFDQLTDVNTLLCLLDEGPGEFDQIAAAIFRVRTQGANGLPALLRVYQQVRSCNRKRQYRDFCATFGVDLPMPINETD